MLKHILSVVIILCVALVFFFIKGRPTSGSTETELQEAMLHSTTVSKNTINNDLQITVNGTHYLYVVTNHGPEKIKSLLRRAESLSKETKPNTEQSKIAIVIHGPDLNLFDKKNYEKYKEIVDLAAQLDAFEIIDFKICKITSDQLGLEKSSYPPFMEMVPSFVDEISRLESKGYVEL